MIMATFEGDYSELFSKIPTLLEESVASDEELGASFFVSVHGQIAVDGWCGWSDTAKTQRWQENTIANVFSTTKLICTVAALLLIDRGLLDPEARVAKYWPEFAANGKQDVLVRHILGHTSGLATFGDSITKLNEIYDTKTSTAALASTPPIWEPGTAGGYHAWNYGHLIGELIRRITGKSLTQFVNEELAIPLNADFQIGAREADWPRISNVIPPPPPTEPPPESPPVVLMAQSFLLGSWTVPDIWTPEFRAAEIGAAGGHGNARGVARILSLITNGGMVLDEETGQEKFGLLRQETVDLIFQEQSRGVDKVTNEFIRRGMGMSLVGDGDTFVDDFMPAGKVCYWGGLGGSMGVMDVERGVTIAYVMNKMGKMGLGNEPVKKYIKAVYQVLGVEVGPVGRLKS